MSLMYFRLAFSPSFLRRLLPRLLRRLLVTRLLQSSQEASSQPHLHTQTHQRTHRTEPREETRAAGGHLRQQVTRATRMHDEEGKTEEGVVLRGFRVKRRRRRAAAPTMYVITSPMVSNEGPSGADTRPGGRMAVGIWRQILSISR